MSAIRRRKPARPAIVLAAAAALALVLGGCAQFKPGSLRLSQPGGIGSVRVHFELCTRGEPPVCEPNKTEGQSQYMLGIAIPKGASVPQTLRTWTACETIVGVAGMLLSLLAFVVMSPH